VKRKIAYQGVKASFSDMAIGRYLGDAVESIGKVSFDAVFTALKSGEVEMVAVPIENTLIGPIVENLDLIARHDMHIIAEVCLPIEHCLVGKKGLKLEEITEVLSHPKALAQCARFFQEHPWIQPVSHFDTAGAARDVSESQKRIAAIGSRKTAETYGLELILENLEDVRSNTTRFLFLQKGPSVTKKEKGKCSLLLTLAHAPGALLQALKVFADNHLNLTQIVSRPIQEKPFEYLFFIDLLFPEDVDLNTIFEELQKHTQTCQLLGVYDPAR
jgi:prephenate dehydratase